MLTKFLLIVAGSVTFFFANRAFSIAKNYRQARKLDLPIVVGWTSWQDIVWALFGPYIKPLLEALGYYKDGIDMATFGWTYNDRYNIHERLGPAFVHVTPFRSVVIVSDMEASKEVLSPWKYWLKEPQLHTMFEVFGKNVLSANEVDWPRHRKITSYGFKESNLKMVWQSTLEQSKSMLTKWERLSAIDSNGVSLEDVRDDMRTLALHVLSAAIFGKHFSFDQGLDHVLQPQHRLSFGAALQGVLSNAGPQLFLVASLFRSAPLWILPTGIRSLILSVHEFQAYLEEAVAEERQRMDAHDSDGSKTLYGQDNLKSAMIQANENAKQAGDAEEAKLVLSDEELYGNLFMFYQAGHESTAGVLGFTVPLLAIYPHIQAWCQEEIDAVINDVGGEVSYGKTWHKLVRLRALMFETLRFFAPVPLFPRWSGLENKTLHIQGKEYQIPPDVFVAVNMNAVHWNPEIWGADVNEFKPARWLSAQGQAGKEELDNGPRGTMLFWSFGPRVCPGQKLSQVEFVASILEVLRGHDLKPVQLAGESLEAARRRLYTVTRDAGHRLAMYVKHPETAGVVCVPRE